MGWLYDLDKRQTKMIKEALATISPYEISSVIEEIKTITESLEYQKHKILQDYNQLELVKEAMVDEFN